MVAFDQQVAGKDQLLIGRQGRQNRRVIADPQGLGMGQGTTTTRAAQRLCKEPLN